MKSRRILEMVLFASVAASASDLATTYQQAASLADAQEKAAATRDYFTQVLLPSYGQKYAPVFQACFASVKQPDSGPFSFVAAIGINGRVVRVYEAQQTNISLCVLDTLKNDAFPAPPESPFYLHIAMKFDGPPASANKATDGAPPLVLASDEYSYTFGVPAGWVFSFDQARQRGATLGFFPKGGSFNDSSSIVYVNELENPCSGECLSPLSLAIANTLRQAKAGAPGAEEETAEAIAMKDGSKASVRTLKGSRDPRNPELKDSEALAFIGHDETIILVVLSSRDPKTWDQDYAAFREIVAGHKFFTCDSPNLAVPCKK